MGELPFKITGNCKPDFKEQERLAKLVRKEFLEHIMNTLPPQLAKITDDDERTGILNLLNVTEKELTRRENE